MILLVYLVGILGVIVAAYVYFKNRRQISELDIEKRVVTLSSIFQLIVVSVGVIVAVETLGSADRQLEFQRQIRTNSLLESVGTKSLSDDADIIRTLLETGFPRSDSIPLVSSQRIKILITKYEDGSAANAFLRLNDNFHRLQVCADSKECDSDRLYGLICGLTDDFVRFDVHQLSKEIPPGASNLLFDAREKMSRWNKIGCSFTHYAIDYLDERYLR